MIGGNFTIKKLWTNQDEIMATKKTCFAGPSQQYSRASFHDNAQRMYRL